MKTVQERVAAAAVQREDALRNRSRLWRWCRRHPWLILIAALIAAPFAYDAWRLYGWRPDVVVKGQIVDYDTGQPVEGAWVSIYIWADGRIFDSNGKLIWYVPEGSSTSMTSPMSTVVQTDKDGRFRYRVSAYDAFQYAGYTKYEVAIGAYKKQYESVSATTGKANLTAVIHLPFTLRRHYHDWLSLKRLPDSQQQLRVLGWPQVPSDATWPNWARYARVLASDRIDHWCDTPSFGELKRSFLSFVEVSTVITSQDALFRSKFISINGPDSQATRNMESSSFRSREDEYRETAPEVPWTLVEVPHVEGSEGPPLFERLTFTEVQKSALCQVMQRQSDDILKKSLDIRGPQ